MGGPVRPNFRLVNTVHSESVWLKRFSSVYIWLPLLASAFKLKKRTFRYSAITLHNYSRLWTKLNSVSTPSGSEWIYRRQINSPLAESFKCVTLYLTKLKLEIINDIRNVIDLSKGKKNALHAAINYLLTRT